MAEENRTNPSPGDFDLIDRPEVGKIMGGMSRSATYEDPDICALAIPMTDGDHKVWRWQRREIMGLVEARIAKRDAMASQRRLEVTERRERSLARKRITPAKQRTGAAKARRGRPRKAASQTAHPET